MSKLVAEYLQHPLSASANIALLDDGNVGGVLGATLGSKLDLAGGKILQIASTTKTDTFSESVAGDSVSGDVSGLSVSITPSLTSSKILISGVVSINANNVGGVLLYRGGAVIAQGDASSSRTPLTSGNAGDGNSRVSSVPFQFLDSPNTTSSTSYTVRLLNRADATQTLYVNRSTGDENFGRVPRASSTITAMEASA